MEGNKKKKAEGYEGKSCIPSSSEVDRISELPDSIIHHILSFLKSPTEVTRTSILSKQWYHQIWASLPFLTLLQKNFERGCPPGPKKAISLKFREYVETTLRRYENNDFHINKFVIDMEKPSWVSAVAKWVKYLLQNHRIEELTLRLETSSSRTRFDLPSSFFSTPKSLESLTLAGCIISPKSFSKDQVIAFRHTLKRLELSSVNFGHKGKGGVLNHIISSCTSLEEIILKWCRGMNELKIPATLDKLRHVKVDVCGRPDRVAKFDIDSPTLESFAFGFLVISGSAQMRWIKMDGCKNLKVLHLRSMAVRSSVLNAIMAQLPRLEELCLEKCDTIHTFTISNSTLKTLRFRSYCSEAVIEAPNLVSFDCTTPEQRIHPRMYSTTHDTVQQSTAKIRILRVHIDWFLSFRKFLLVSKHLNRVDISIDFDEVEFEDLLCPISSLPTSDELLGHLSLVVSNLSSNYVAFLDALLRSCCPHELTLALYDDRLGSREHHTGFVECLYNKLEHIGHTWCCFRDNCDGDCSANDVEIEICEEARGGLNKNKKKISGLSALINMLPTITNLSSHQIHFRMIVSNLGDNLW